MISRHYGIALLGQILGIYHLHTYIQVMRTRTLQKGMDKVQPKFVAMVIDDIINLIQMQQTLHPPHQPFGEVYILIGQNLLYVNMFWRNRFGVYMAVYLHKILYFEFAKIRKKSHINKNTIY